MTLFIWIGFVVFVVAMVLLDLGVFHRKAHVVSLPEALAWTAAWVALALAFNVLIYFLYAGDWLGWADLPSHRLTGKQAALQYLTGYLLEKSLSIDNIFVIAMIFSYFRVPLAEQHRVLYWGILGAVVLRGVMIAGGAALMARFDWIVYVFGALLLVTATKMLLTRHDTIDPERNLAVRWLRKVYPISSQFDGGRFFTVVDGRRAATPLFLALILVETSDVMFAVDSIPAIFAITRDPFLVFTSNVFAILGLRSLYFALAGLMEKFRYIKLSLVFVLAYIGVKMLLVHHFPIPTGVSLAVICGILGVGVASSIAGAHRDPRPLASPLLDDFEELALGTYRQARRVVVLVIGSTLLLVGIAMIVLPGPAILVIPLGLGILAAEFEWARRWLRRSRETLEGVKRRLRKKRQATG